MRQLKTMIPKAEFGKLRNAVLSYLRKNAEANGFSHVAEDQLRGFTKHNNAELKPFQGMSPMEKAAATDYFWNYLLKTGDLKKYSGELGSSGVVYYHLPEYPPFQTVQEVLKIIESRSKS